MSGSAWTAMANPGRAFIPRVFGCPGSRPGLQSSHSDP
jgi:hypothetical protein